MEAAAEGRRAEARLSPTVSAVRDDLAEQGRISVVTLAQAVLRRHPEYGRDQAASLVLEERGGDMERQPVDAWLAEVRTLYDAKAAAELHGRLVVIGLGLLSHTLREQLVRSGLWDALVSELREPLDSLLTSRAKALLEPSDRVRPLSDNPLERLDQDELGRAAFARFLARRVAALSKEEGAYAIHLYGPWGAGKSTLLNFLCEILQEGAEAEKGANMRSKWLVVEFNAWRHQHVHPPWWVLLDTVFQQTRHELRPWDRAQEYFWRLSAGRGAYLVSMIILILLVWALVLVVLPYIGVPSANGEEVRTTNGEGPTVAKDVIDTISTLAAAAVTLWGIASAVAGSLLISSPRAAQNYVEVTRNPMTAVKNHFKRLIERLGSHRVMVLIDDLDRCRSEYVVELLEGIQTLFRDAPVIYVVAADRRWLNACYEEIYQGLKPGVHAPGKSLGTLFLEKAFQLATPVPAVPRPIKEAYWRSLLGVRTEEVKRRSDDAELRAEGRVDDLVDETAMLRRLHDSQDPLEQQAIRERIVTRLAEPEVLAHTEHALSKFASLLDPNPRAMKRLLNAYATYRALTTLCHIHLDRDQLALWTILSLRWPLLADALADDPELLEGRDQPDREPVADAMRGLLDNEEVRDVIEGKRISRKPLDVETIRQWAQLGA